MNNERMLPPWLKYPQIPLGSLGWRMGAGEEYWYEFKDWYRTLSPEEKERFSAANPPPERWEEFYTWMEQK